MDDLFEAPAGLGVTEDERAECAPVQGAVIAKDAGSELGDHGMISGLAGHDGSARQRVGVDESGAALLEHCRHGALSRGDPAGDANDAHRRASLLGSEQQPAGRRRYGRQPAGHLTYTTPAAAPTPIAPPWAPHH